MTEISAILASAIFFCSVNESRVQAVAHLHSPVWPVDHSLVDEETRKPVEWVWCTHEFAGVQAKPCVGDPATECALQY